MTVSSTSAYTAFSGNGSTTVFATSFAFFDDSDVVVTLVSSAGVETVKTISTHYTVSGGDGSTGSVTMLTAPASGETLVLTRALPYTQASDYQSNDPLPAEVFEEDLDRSVMLAQQVLDLAKASPRLPATFNPGNDTRPTIELPDAGKVLIANAGETGWEHSTIADLGLADLPVVLTAPANGDLLRYNGTEWINTTTLNGSYTVASLTVSGLQAMSGAALNMAKGADIASAATTDIGAATGNYVDVTGTTTITGLGTVQAGTRRTVRFTGALVLTHNATTLILPGSANITTTAGSVGEFVSLGSGNWRCTGFTWADGRNFRAVVGDTGSGGSQGLVPAPAAGDAAAGKVLSASGAWLGGAVSFSYTQPSGTNGGAGTDSAWTKYPLNTTDTNLGSIASLASNVVTIAATGVYDIDAMCQFDDGIQTANIRLRKTNGTAATMLVGSPVDARDNTHSPAVHMRGLVSLTAGDTLEVQYYGGSFSGGATRLGFALGVGEVERYGWLIVKRVT